MELSTRLSATTAASDQTFPNATSPDPAHEKLNRGMPVYMPLLCKAAYLRLHIFHLTSYILLLPSPSAFIPQPSHFKPQPSLSHLSPGILELCPIILAICGS